MLGVSPPLVTVNAELPHCHCDCDVQTRKPFSSLARRIFSPVPYSPLEFKVRMRLQISSVTEELAYHKMNLTTEDGRDCPALSRGFFPNVF